MSNSVKVLLEERRQQTLDRIEEVNDRVSELFHQLENDKAILLQKVDDKGEELKALLIEFKVLFLFLLQHNMNDIRLSLTETESYDS